MKNQTEGTSPSNRSWQAFGLACSLIVIPLLTGCQMASLFRATGPTAPQIFPPEAVPTNHQLIAAIQKNTAAVKQVNSTVKVVMDGMPASARGTLLMERPNRMRLKVGILGMTDSGIDIGSNEQRFWIFNKSSFGGQQPAVYYANHSDYANSQLSKMLRLQPQWLIDAIGLVEFDPAFEVQGPYQKGKHLELVTTIPSPSGNMRRMLTLDGRTGTILQQAIYDSENQLIAWARSSKHRYFPEHDANLPQHIQLTMVAPDGKETSLSIEMLNYTLNSLYVNPDVTWKMPTPGDVPVIDLTTVDVESFQPLAQNPGSQNFTPTADRPRPFRFGKLKGFDLR